MSKSFTETPGESGDQSTTEIAKHVEQAENVAEHRAGYHRKRRAAYIAGAVVAVAAVIGIFFVTVLPTLAPRAPASVQPAVTSGLGPDDLRRIARDTQVTQATAPAPMPASLEGPSAIAAATPVLMPASLEGPSTSQASTAAPSAVVAAPSLMPMTSDLSRWPWTQSPAPVDAYWESISQRAMPSQMQPSAQSAPGFMPVAPEPAIPPDWLMGTASQTAPPGISEAGSVTSRH